MTKKKTTVLRELINRKEILYRVGVAIALDAKMAEAVGPKPREIPQPGSGSGSASRKAPDDT